MKNTIAVIALLACGIIKEAPAGELTPDQQNECLQRAQTAYAVVHARDMGKPREDLLTYIKENESPKVQPAEIRIVHQVYNRPETTKSTAFNGEYTGCLAAMRKNTKQKVVAK